MTPKKKLPSDRAQQTRSDILQATRTLLAQGDPGAFSLRSVAARAGRSLSNVQFHYCDQATLLRALFDDELWRGRELVEKALAVDAGGSRSTAVARALDALLDQQRSVETMKIYLALWSYAATHPVVRDALQAFYARFVQQIVDYLQARGPRRPTAATRDRAQVAVVLLEGAAIFRSGILGTPGPRHEQLLKSTLLGLLVPKSPRRVGVSTRPCPKAKISPLARPPPPVSAR